MELIRELLLKLREGPFPTRDVAVSGFTREEINYNLYQLLDAGFIDAEPEIDEGGAVHFWEVNRLKWAGHEFIDAASSESVWQHARRKLAEKGIEVPFGVLQSLLEAVLKGRLFE